MSKKIVIIGGVAAGPKAASRARRHNPEAEITIIERGDVFSYAGCGMPFYIEGVIEDINELLRTPLGILRDEKYFKVVKNIKILGMTKALQINRGDKTVTVKELKTERVYEIPYDKLVIATGARPIMPRIKGVDLSGVYYLSNPTDAKSIRSQVARAM